MSKATLLVVEDEPNLLLGIRDILELDEYRVLTAQNGKEALDVLHQAEDKLPDLIVSDIMMPHMDGIELLQRVRQQDKWVTIPFIFLTAKGEKSDVQRGKILGVDDYLIKPFDADDLLVAVQAKLSRSQVLREAQTSAIDGVKRGILTILNHEMRTPLTLVVAYADMLKDQNVDSMNEEELITFLREINNGADRLRRLIENFILLVELDSGDAEKTYTWRKYKIVDLPNIIQAAHNQVKESRPDYDCQVSVPDSIPPIIGDRDYITVMIRELLDNAAKFANGHPVSLEVTATDDALNIHVIDKGRGIAAQELESIWQKFYQVNRDHYEDQGAGSGLAIVKGLADIHGAQIDVETEFGSGSMFTLSFPRIG